MFGFFLCFAAVFLAFVVRHGFRLRRIRNALRKRKEQDDAIVDAYFQNGEPPDQCRYCGVKLSHASSNEELVTLLVENGVLRPELADVFRKVDRGLFLRDIPAADLPFPGRGLYLDCAYAVGCNAQISAPHIHALTLGLLAQPLHDPTHMLGQRLQRDGDISILDVGSGTGFVTACLSVLGGEKCTVIGKEHMPELVKMSRGSVLAIPHCRRMTKLGKLRIVVGDGRDCSCPETKGKQFDLIHCGASVESVSKEMLQLLRPGGRLVIPVGSQFASDQVITTVDRSEDGASFHTESHFGIRVRYIPLTARESQSDDAQVRFEGESDDEGVTGSVGETYKLNRDTKKNR